MVEAAIWLMVQGDRAGAEDLLAQVLRIDPTHERARQAMKSLGVQTSPGQEAPHPPIPHQTMPVTPPATYQLAPESRTPLEPTPALRPEPPREIRRTTFPGTGAGVGDMTLPPGRSELPFASSPSSTEDEDASAAEITGETLIPPELLDERDEQTARVGHLVNQRPPPAEKTDRHLSLVIPSTSSTHPRLPAMPAALGEAAITSTGTARALGRVWSLEVLTGPHTGKLIVMKRSTMFGRGLGALDIDDDPFVSPGHASFVQKQGDLFISDGGSASGTWVSIDVPTRIQPGDSFSAGLQRFRYLGPLEEAPFAEPMPYGAPRPAASWRLEHVLVGDRGCRVWVLRGVITLGREGAHLRFPDDDAMAMAHVEMRPAGTALELIDRSARAGTFVSLANSGERKLGEGTRIRIGSTVFRVSSKGP